MRALTAVLFLLISATASLTQERFAGELEFSREANLAAKLDCPEHLVPTIVEHNGNKYPGKVAANRLFIKPVSEEHVTLELTFPKGKGPVSICRSITLGIQRERVQWMAPTKCGNNSHTYTPYAYVFEEPPKKSYGEWNIPRWLQTVKILTSALRGYRQECGRIDRGPSEAEQKLAAAAEALLSTATCEGNVTDLGNTGPSNSRTITFADNEEGLTLYHVPDNGWIVIRFFTREKYDPDGRCKVGSVSISPSEKRVMMGGFMECDGVAGDIPWESAYRFDQTQKRLHNSHLLDRWIHRGELALAALNRIAALCRK